MVNCNNCIFNIEYKHISQAYKHITYIGSILSSIIIFELNTYFTHCGDIYHRIIIYLIMFKSFLLYDSTFLEYIHHIAQFALAYYGYNHLNVCNRYLFTLYKSCNCILITPVFLNLKYYLRLPQDTFYYDLLDLTAFISFFYYRVQFNYIIWNGNALNAIISLFYTNQLFQSTETFVQEQTCKNVVVVYGSLCKNIDNPHPIKHMTFLPYKGVIMINLLYIFSLMNVYWGYLFIQKMRHKKHLMCYEPKPDNTINPDK